ncbi:hypothetical protein PDTK01_36530 [Phycicoccus sp. DTK01]|nr:hypothetical protein PDTK01_36530 [Phycicoccus sp. DTK01]
MKDPQRGHRRLWATVATVLLLAGFGLLGKTVADQRSAPEPPLTATAPTPDASPPAPPPTSRSTGPSAPASPNPPGLSRSRATHVRIPSVKIDSVVNETGLAGDGTIQVPVHGPHYDEAAWFTGSPAPGQVGPSVVLGHVDSVSTGPSVFFELGAVKKGDDVEVSRADGKTVAFEVYRIDRYPKDDFPTGAVYGNTAGPELRLITCGGTIDDTTGHYTDNVVVYAKAVGA